MASVLPTMVHILESLTLSKWVAEAEGYVTGENAGVALGCGTLRLTRTPLSPATSLLKPIQ